MIFGQHTQRESCARLLSISPIGYTFFPYEKFWNWWHSVDFWSPNLSVIPLCSVKNGWSVSLKQMSQEAVYRIIHGLINFLPLYKESYSIKWAMTGHWFTDLMFSEQMNQWHFRKCAYFCLFLIVFWNQGTLEMLRGHVYYQKIMINPRDCLTAQHGS